MWHAILEGKFESTCLCTLKDFILVLTSTFVIGIECIAPKDVLIVAFIMELFFFNTE